MIDKLKKIEHVSSKKLDRVEKKTFLCDFQKGSNFFDNLRPERRRRTWRS